MSIVAVLTAGAFGEVLLCALAALAVDLVAAVRVVRLGSDRYRFGSWSKIGWLVVIFGVTWHLGALDIPIGAVLALYRTAAKPAPPSQSGHIPFAEGDGWPEGWA